MKKKGLIISTVVMVVVLIASLTTATYAWFTASSKTAISDITVSVGAGSDVKIGVKTSNVYAAGATDDAFMSDTVEFAPTATLASGSTGEWSAGTPGLGPNLTFENSTINVVKGIGTAATDNATTADAAWNTTNKVIKAEGSKGSTTIKNTEAAVVNTDYIDALLGVAATTKGLKNIVCNITVNPTDTKLAIGMNAALHVRYRINDGEWQEKDIYETATNATSKKNINTKVTNDQITGGELADGWKRFQITVAALQGEETELVVDKIYQLHLIIFMAGYDNDCNDNGTGVSSQIKIDFTAEKNE